MSRNGPIGQLGMRPPARRQTSDDQQPTQPITQPSPHWPPQYAEPPAQRGQQQQGYGQQPAPGYYFPQPGAEGDAAHGYAQQAQANPLPFNRFPPAPEAAPQASAHQLPFNRFPPPAGEADPNYGYAQQGSEQQQAPFSFPHTASQQQPGSAGPPWGHQGGQQADPRGYDLGSYMSAPGQQGYAQSDAFDAQQEPPPFAAPQGYGETDAEFDEAMAEEEEEPRRGRRGLMIVAALVGAIGLGGGMAYGYKTFFPSRSGPAPVIKDTQGPIKSKPEVADGKGFPHTDKKLLNRLGDEAGTPGAGAAPDTPEANDDPNAPRKVRSIPIQIGNGPQPMPGMVVSGSPGPAGPPPLVVVPGVSLEGMGPPPSRGQFQQAPPSAARVQLPPPAQPARVAQQPPVRIASANNMPPPAAAEPAAPAKKAPVVAKAAPAKQPVPKKEASAAPAVTASSGAGFVAVLSSQKTRMDALKIFANMQEKYGEVLSSRTPDVQEANLGEKGVWYRLVVGPPGSRDAAAGVCTQLKTAGFAGCWVTSY
jgi:sporulation related protein